MMESNIFQRERLLRVAIGKTINGNGTPWSLMPPLKKQKHKKIVTYVGRFNGKRLKVNMERKQE